MLLPYFYAGNNAKPSTLKGMLSNASGPFIDKDTAKYVH